MKDKFIMSVSPHLHEGSSTREVMKDVLLALMPAALVGVIFFGWRAFIVMAVSILTAVATEYGFQKIFKRPQTIGDLSAVVTGLLLAFSISSAVPWWAVAIGSFVAIFFAKMVFGGIGFNVFNPALVGRAFLMASFPVMMTTWYKPFAAVTQATPLGIIKEGSAASLPSLAALFMGNVGGCIGETSVLALLVGAGYLFYKKIIDWRIPGTYLLTVVVFALLSGQSIPFHLMAGGLILGAFFMATDYTTSPMMTKGKFIFGIGLGVLTMVIRLYGGYPEGVSYAILIMNMFVPLLDRMR